MPQPPPEGADIISVPYQVELTLFSERSPSVGKSNRDRPGDADEEAARARADRPIRRRGTGGCCGGGGGRAGSRGGGGGAGAGCRTKRGGGTGGWARGGGAGERGIGAPDRFKPGGGLAPRPRPAPPMGWGPAHARPLEAPGLQTWTAAS